MCVLTQVMIVKYNVVHHLFIVVYDITVHPSIDLCCSLTAEFMVQLPRCVYLCWIVMANKFNILRHSSYNENHVIGHSALQKTNHTSVAPIKKKKIIIHLIQMIGN